MKLKGWSARDHKEFEIEIHSLDELIKFRDEKQCGIIVDRNANGDIELIAYNGHLE